MAAGDSIAPHRPVANTGVRGWVMCSGPSIAQDPHSPSRHIHATLSLTPKPRGAPCSWPRPPACPGGQ